MAAEFKIPTPNRPHRRAPHIDVESRVIDVERDVPAENTTRYDSLELRALSPATLKFHADLYSKLTEAMAVIKEAFEDIAMHETYQGGEIASVRVTLKRKLGASTLELTYGKLDAELIIADIKRFAA